MEINIKCSECGKGTRKFELGKIFYLHDNPSESLIIKNKIICPKCKKDISDNKCIIKANELLVKIIASNISKSVGKVPSHLRGAYLLMEQDYDRIKNNCLSKLKLV